MKFVTLLTAFEPNAQLRIVEVPLDEVHIQCFTPTDILATLDIIYQYGQTDIQPLDDLRSLTTGDIVHLPHQAYLCCADAWKPITKDQVRDYCNSS